jgi:hypothetical protein
MAGFCHSRLINFGGVVPPYFALTADGHVFRVDAYHMLNITSSRGYVE